MSVSPILTLLRHAWARHRIPLIPIALAIGLFEFILTRMAPAPNEVSWVAGLLSSLPTELQTLVGSNVAMTPGGFLAIGYGHPFFVLLLSTWVVRSSSAAVAGEVGMGTMDLLASRPTARWHFVAAGMKTVAIGLAVILAGAIAGTAAGLRLRELDVSASAFVPIVAGAWLLFAAWGAIALAISASRRDGGQAIGWATAIMAGSFVLDYLARLWAPIAFLRPVSLFRYYEPQVIFASGLRAGTVGVLVGTLLTGLAVGVVVMNRRDL